MISDGSIFVAPNGVYKPWQLYDRRQKLVAFQGDFGMLHDFVLAFDKGDFPSLVQENDP